MNINPQAWFDYWAKSYLTNRKVTDKFILYTLVVEGQKEDDWLNFYVDKRMGKTFNVIFLYNEPGKQGSVMANPEEANFLEDKANSWRR